MVKVRLVPFFSEQSVFCGVQGCSCLADWAVKGTSAKLCGHHKVEGTSGGVAGGL